MELDARSSDPIFIIGRQYSGNTLLATIFHETPTVLSMRGEDTFFEHQSQLERLDLKERVDHVVKLIAKSDAPPLPADLCNEVKYMLLHEIQNKRLDDTAIALYSRAMDYLTIRYKKLRWAKKATSYIFYVESILRAFPSAKLIFLVRNPLDIAASAKRRKQRHMILRMCVGWNKGILLAQRFQEKYPRNFMIARYEDLVLEPRTTLKQIFDFVEIKFDPTLADRVSLVNPSEMPYNLNSKKIGIVSSRVFYFLKALDPVEEASVRSLIDHNLLEQMYPEFTQRRSGIGSLRCSLSIVGLVSVGIFSVCREHIRLAITNPMYVLDRIRRRFS